jgi:hypothetical protein
VRWSWCYIVLPEFEVEIPNIPEDEIPRWEAQAQIPPRPGLLLIDGSPT